jgi:hypothetical protein
MLFAGNSHIEGWASSSRLHNQSATAVGTPTLKDRRVPLACVTSPPLQSEHPHWRMGEFPSPAEPVRHCSQSTHSEGWASSPCLHNQSATAVVTYPLTRKFSGSDQGSESGPSVEYMRTDKTRSHREVLLYGGGGLHPPPELLVCLNAQTEWSWNSVIIPQHSLPRQKSQGPSCACVCY